ncbi:MAG: hypothetical protein K2H56_03075 [Malacoplasma sp.]|nr:hypothetical protein [Malacoplasma sp.]
MSNYSNNNGYNNNIPYNQNNNQPYNQNYNQNQVYNYNNQQKPPEDLLKSVKKASIAYIILFFLAIILIVVGWVFLISWIFNSNDAFSYPYDNYNFDYQNNLPLTTDFYVGVALLVIGILCGISLFIISIVLVVKSGKLKNYSNYFDTIFILFVVGIFIGLSSLVASFMSISWINKIK